MAEHTRTPPVVESLKRAVLFGLENGKRNVIADLVPLKALFDSHDELLAACAAMLRCTGGSSDWNGETHDVLVLIEAAVAKATATP